MFERQSKLPLDLRRFRCERDGAVGRRANGLREREVHLLIGEPQRVFGEWPFFGRRRHAHELFGRRERALVDDDVAIGRRATDGVRGRGPELLPGSVDTDAHGEEQGNDQDDRTVLLERHCLNSGEVHVPAQRGVRRCPLARVGSDVPDRLRRMDTVPRLA